MVKGSGIDRIRTFNCWLVLNSLREHGPVSRTMLARSLGLSRTTISIIMNGLLREGLVREGNFLDASSKGGRRAAQIYFHANAGCILGIAMGPTHLTMVLMNWGEEIVSQRSMRFDFQRGPAICLPLLRTEMHTFVNASSIQWETITGIGFGLPGIRSGSWHRSGTLSHLPGGWDTVNLWEWVHHAFHKPVLIDHDVCLGALRASRLCKGKDVVYVTIDADIRCGLLLDGQMYRGRGENVGALGHLSIDENGPVCLCGNRGCLETLVTVQAIVRDAQQGFSLAQRQGEADEPSLLLANQTPLDFFDVVVMARQGDASSWAALAKAGERIGQALISLINLLNPAAILLDGEVTHAGEVLLAPLRRAVASVSFSENRKAVQLLMGEPENTTVALGAALMILDAMFSMNTFLT